MITQLDTKATYLILCDFRYNCEYKVACMNIDVYCAVYNKAIDAIHRGCISITNRPQVIIRQQLGEDVI